jgi:hypothetical protein
MGCQPFGGGSGKHLLAGHLPPLAEADQGYPTSLENIRSAKDCQELAKASGTRPYPT